MRKNHRILSVLLIALGLGAAGFAWLGRTHTRNASLVPQPSVGVSGNSGGVSPGAYSEQPSQVEFQVASTEQGSGRAAMVQGFVLGSDNMPVPGAVVETYPGGLRLAVTENNGEFTFPYNAPGTVLHARKDAVQSAPAIASAATLERSLVLTLKEVGRLSVRVVSADTQKAVAGATLKLLRGSGTSDKDEEMLTDRRGIASFALGVGGNLQVTATADGFGAVHRRFWAAPSSTGEQQLTLALPPACSARGIVRNGQGQPAARARVTARDISSNQPSISVDADDQGRFRFAQLHAAVFTFEAVEQTLGWGQSTLVELPSSRDIAITINSDPSLRGVVVDIAGRAVAAASVQVLPQAGGAYRLPERRQQVTDAEGRFAFLGLPTTRVMVGAISRGMASDTVDIDLSRQSSVELRLGASDGISGMVVDAAGHHVPGALVTAKLQGQPAARRLVTSAGPDGTFTLLAVGTGKWDIFARAPTDLVGGEEIMERVLATVEAGAMGVSLVVPGAGAIEGWIELDDGAVPDNAALILSGRALISPSGGSFLFQGIPEGTHEIVVTGPGFEAIRLPDVVVRANETTALDAIRVHAGRRVRGRVTNANRQPIAGVEIMASTSLYAAAQGLNRSSPEDQPDLRYASSDEFGAFELRGLGRSRIGVMAEHPTYGRSKIAIVEAEASGELALVLQPTADVQGKVTKAGAPLEGIAVFAKDTGGIATFSAISGSDGVYQLVRLPAGEYAVTAINRQSSGNFDMRKRDIILTPGNKQSIDFDFGSPGSTISVHVTDDSPKPQSAFLKGPSVYVQQTRKNGAYVFQDVVPGEYNLCIIFDAEGREAVAPRCQALSVAAEGKTQEVRL